MKRKLFVALLVAIGAICCAIGLSACDDETKSVDGMELESQGGGYVVRGLEDENITDLVISAEYDGKPVTTIGDGAFGGCTNLISITIPDSVTTIENYAFNGCSNLTNITIPDSVTFIGEFAFHNCSSLTNITIPNGITSIEYQTFTGCSSLKSITIPNGVTSIGDMAFMECSSLTSVTIPDNVKTIGMWAFRDCSSLESVTIPDNVTSIGEHPFYSCDNIISATAPAFAFGYIPRRALQTVVITSGEHIGSDDIDHGYTFSGCSDLKSITIPDTATSIGKLAFNWCTSLSSITIPKNVKSIGERAFVGCTGLESITVAEENKVFHVEGNCLIDTANKTLILGCNNSVIPTDGSVTIIGECAFVGRNDITTLTIPDCITSIGEYAFGSCDNIISATAPAFAFDYIPKNSLQTAVITSGEYISDEAFSWGISLKSITISDSVTSFGEDAFSYCGNVINVTAPALVFDYYTFRYNTFQTVVITSGDTINDFAFCGCINLTSIIIPDTVTSIGYSAFEECINLTNITIPSRVTYIGERAFYNCYKLVEVCNLSALNINGGSSIGYLGYYALNIYTPTNGESKLKTTDDGFIFLEDNLNVYLISYTGDATSLSLPNTFNNKNYTIHIYAFYYCHNLTDINIPNGVTHISTYAFEDCRSLTNITIANSVTYIDYSAFSGSNFITINFEGTKAEWQAIDKHVNWAIGTSSLTVQCTDGKLDKKGNEIQ